MTYQALQTQLAAVLADTNASLDQRLLTICEILDREISYFNWTGFYFRDGDKEQLKLGPYVGAPTDHTIIPFGRGICGQVAVSNETFEVPDVTAADNYLACSLETKAEIVVPIFKDGVNIGQIDIDSHQLDPFTQADRDLLDWLCTEIGKLI